MGFISSQTALVYFIFCKIRTKKVYKNDDARKENKRSSLFEMGRYNRGRKDHAIDPTSRYCSRQHNLSQTLILQNTFPSSFSVSMNSIDILMRLTYIWAGWWTPIFRERCSENSKLPPGSDLENTWIQVLD